MTTQKKKVGVIKRSGKRPSEPYNHDKLRGSILAACLSVRSPEGDADQVATIVCDSVGEWCSNRNSVTSDDVRRVASRYLENLQPEAAYLYQHHQFVL